jgi:D-3-phosphoglycerate dehydrogenase / 2-oxoglutarate reductase
MTPLESRVLVTPTSFGRSDPSIRLELERQVGEVVYNDTGKPLRAAELGALIAGFDGYIAGLDEVTAEVLAAAGQLKVIARYGVGVDQVDLVAARDRGIVVTNTPGANSKAVAELAVGLMLALARSIPQASQDTKAGGWPRLAGFSLEGRTVGLYGLGAIGKEVARRLRGFDCTVLAHDVAPDREFAAAEGVQLCSPGELLGAADFLSLHCPVVPETRGLVDDRFLDAMKPGAFFINTARGELVDEGCLLTALRSGHLRGAALDVYSHEPPGADHPLLALPQVIATPHMASTTDSATNAMGRMALADCLAVLRGDPPRYPVL